MKLTVTVTFGKNEQTFDIPVGDGQKTVKWLATVASQRFSARAPHGRLRAREPLMAQPQASAYMPSSVTTADSSFFHPEAMLAEKMHDGQKVTVALAPRIPVDEIGQQRFDPGPGRIILRQDKGREFVPRNRYRTVQYLG